jgi:hypothetical protein
MGEILMAISVGGHTFDGRATVAREAYEIVGGSRTRAIRITGIVRGAGNLASLVAALDTIAKAASENVPTLVSLRAGRRLFARREKFSREVNARALIGSFVLDLRADDAWEESDTVNESLWSIALSGATRDVTNDGNADAMPVITLTAENMLHTPALSDGIRTLTYEGTVPTGAILVVDSILRRVLLDGADVTPYASGDFPMLAPGETTLEYTDDPSSTHFAQAVVSFRDRWW